MQITLKEKREHMNYNKFRQNTYKWFAHRFLELDNLWARAHIGAESKKISDIIK